MSSCNSSSQYKVFVSHGKPDTWLAAQVARRAQDCGASTFLDETDIRTGDDFKRIIHREIAQSEELIVLFTPWSVQRFWVWVEVGAAWGLEKRIIAVLYGLKVSQLEELGGSKAVLDDIDVIDINDFDKYFVELSERIRRESSE